MKQFEIIEKIENINIFQNIENPDFNSCVIIFRNEKDKPFLLYFEKIDKKTSFEKINNYIQVGTDYNLSNQDFTLTTKIFLKDKTLFKLYNLSFEEETKEMTKEEIEKALGYKIKII